MAKTCCSATLSLPLYKIVFLTRLSSFVRNILFWSLTSLADGQQPSSLTWNLSVTFSWGYRPRQRLRTCSDACWVLRRLKLNGVVKMNRSVWNERRVVGKMVITIYCRKKIFILEHSGNSVSGLFSDRSWNLIVVSVGVHRFPESYFRNGLWGKTIAVH